MVVLRLVFYYSCNCGMTFPYSRVKNGTGESVLSHNANIVLPVSYWSFCVTQETYYRIQHTHLVEILHCFCTDFFLYSQRNFSKNFLGVEILGDFLKRKTDVSVTKWFFPLQLHYFFFFTATHPYSNNSIAKTHAVNNFIYYKYIN